MPPYALRVPVFYRREAALTPSSHRTLKNAVKLKNDYFPWELEVAPRDFVAYYNHERYHESLYNVTPADAYFCRKLEVVSEQEKNKQRRMRKRKKEHLAAMAA